MRTRLHQWLGGSMRSLGSRGLVLPLLLATHLATLRVVAQPAPHHFVGITTRPDGNVEVTLDGSVSGMFNLTGAISNQFMQMFDLYPIECSSDLLHWTPLAVLLRTNSDSNALCFQENNASGLDHCFYRTPTNHLLTAFPKPTGPFAVGSMVRVLTDSARNNRYGLHTNCSFMSTIWYPADPQRATSLPGAYTEEAVAGDRAFYTYWGWAPQWTNVLLRCVAHSIPNAPLPAVTDRFPVILHSHGYTCDRTLNSQLASELASHGYVVAAVDHEDCHATVFPDARGARYVAPGSLTDVALGYSRLKDLDCLLGELIRMDTNGSVLAGRLDLNAVGIMGFSMGGGIAAEQARLDSRVKCAALLDAWIPPEYFPELSSVGLGKPFLTMNHTINDHGQGDYGPYSQPLFDLASSDAVWFKITDTGHFTFSDIAWSVELTPSSREAGSTINAFAVWFFNKYLKGQTNPIPQRSNVVSLKMK